MFFSIKRLPMIFFVSFVAFLIISLIVIGLSFWILIFGLIWLLFYMVFITQKLKFSFLKIDRAWVFLGLLIIVSLFFIYFVNPSSISKSVKTLSADECKPIYEKYNNKILDISGENLKGTVGITIDSNDCRAKTYYNFLITDNLSKNYRQKNLNFDEYEYISTIRESNDKYKYGSTQIFPIFAEKSSFPVNIFGYGSTENGATGDEAEGKSTNKFYTGWSSSYIFTENSIEKLLARNVFELIDSSNFVTKETTSDSNTSYYTDSDKAADEGPVIKTINLTYTER